ncbi:MAG: UDP-glucose 4-epimerase GalE [Methylotenera sp.]|nr:UDP-glucose 4-epimerase GalE [Methylotenera sp.]
MILVTGGAGYIGSHTCVALLQAGYEVLVLDNLCNGNEESIRRVEMITGKNIHFVHADVRDRVALREIFSNYHIEGVLHFAGLKSISESINSPLNYYDNNVSGSIALVQVMAEFGVHTLVFSSTAAVYGCAAASPLHESAPTVTTNPYGRSKLMIEQIYTDLAVSSDCWGIALLRYFNPVGAHESGAIGESSIGAPDNLMPNICHVAARRLEQLEVFGSDYPTKDGTGVRDYIHVMDLAEGHVCALAWLHNKSGAHVFNLGTGQGYSVLEMVSAFEHTSGLAIPYKISPRRVGDLAAIYANPNKAQNTLGWKAERDLVAMCRDARNWQQQNPHGY